MLELRVRIPPEQYMSASCECCVLSGRGLCDGPIPCSEESYFVCVCVIEYDHVQQYPSIPTRAVSSIKRYKIYIVGIKRYKVYIVSIKYIKYI
jgi:hypothetical protein